MAVIVAFVSQKGGVGKSTLARALLAVAAHSMKVRLADLDPRQASVVAWERTRRRNDVDPPCEVVAYRTVEEAIARSGEVDLLIVDAPAGTSRATVDIANVSHLVVQPTGPSADDLVPAVLVFHELVKEGVPKERLAIAICRVLNDREEATTRQYVKAAGYQVLAGAISERSAYREAQNLGRSITETSTAKLNAKADALIEALLDKVSEEVTRKLRGTRKKKMEER